MNKGIGYNSREKEYLSTERHRGTQILEKTQDSFIWKASIKVQFLRVFSLPLCLERFITVPQRIPLTTDYWLLTTNQGFTHA